MKILKIIGLAILAIIVIILVIALFVKKDYNVERQVTIYKNQDEVFNFIKYLKNQEKYSKWANMDPEMKKDYKGIDGTEGFISSWDSKKKEVGKGEQEIKKITDNQRIDYELRFFEPFESTEYAYIICEKDTSAGTKVKWGFNGHMNYPMNLMLLFMNMEEMIGNDLQTGLDNLKIVLESQNTKKELGLKSITDDLLKDFPVIIEKLF